MKRRRLIRLLVSAIGTYLGVCTIAGAWLAEVTLHPGRRQVHHRQEAAARVAHDFGAVLEDVEIPAADGVPLRGWFVRPAAANENAVVLLHGVSDNREGMGGYALLFLHHGYSVLLPDARAHGESGGTLATYGLLESADIQRWARWLRERQTTHCVFGFGESMGASLILQALRSAPSFCAVAAESSFATFREVAYDRLGQRFGVGDWLGRTLLRPIAEVGMLYARWRYSVDLERANPEDAVAATQIPVLLIHGSADDNIPPRHSEQIHARNPAHATLWIVPGAGHGGAVGAAPAEFESRLLDWFRAR